MSFKESVSKPGDDVELVLKASPGSKFAVSAVDQSVLLMADSNDIKGSQVYQSRLGPGVWKKILKCDVKIFKNLAFKRLKKISLVNPFVKNIILFFFIKINSLLFEKDVAAMEMRRQQCSNIYHSYWRFSRRRFSLKNPKTRLLNRQQDGIYAINVSFHFITKIVRV